MITSTANAQVKQLLQWQKKSRQRNKDGIFLVEGIRMWKEVPKERLIKVYVSESFLKRYEKDLKNSTVKTEVLSDQIFERVSDTQTPQGILCVVKRKEHSLNDILKGDALFLVILDNLQDPGNLGTIVRTAEGAGVDGIIMSQGCVDIYNPKTIRSTMGSIYRMPFLYAEHMDEVFGLLKEKQITVYAAHLEGKTFYDEQDYRKGCAFLIGNEGNGLSEEMAASADVKIRIPMYGQVESLNAAVATSVLMYEASRQRRNKNLE